MTISRAFESITGGSEKNESTLKDAVTILGDMNSRDFSPGGFSDDGFGASSNTPSISASRNSASCESAALSPKSRLHIIGSPASRTFSSSANASAWSMTATRNFAKSSGSMPFGATVKTFEAQVAAGLGDCAYRIGPSACFAPMSAGKAASSMRWAGRSIRPGLCGAANMRCRSNRRRRRPCNAPALKRRSRPACGSSISSCRFAPARESASSPARASANRPCSA